MALFKREALRIILKPEHKEKRQSNAKYCKAYREKFKHDEIYREKNKNKCKAYHNRSLTAEDLEAKRAANRIRSKKYRDSKKQKVGLLKEKEKNIPLMTSTSKPKRKTRKAISCQREAQRKEEKDQREIWRNLLESSQTLVKNEPPCSSQPQESNQFPPASPTQSMEGECGQLKSSPQTTAATLSVNDLSPSPGQRIVLKPEVKKKRHSIAEICKAYRERVKNDESYREKNKDKCKAYRNRTLTAEDLEAKREANRIRNKKYRDSKKQKALQDKEKNSPLMTSISKPKPKTRKAIISQREAQRKEEKDQRENWRSLLESSKTLENALKNEPLYSSQLQESNQFLSASPTQAMEGECGQLKSSPQRTDATPNINDLSPSPCMLFEVWRLFQNRNCCSSSSSSVLALQIIHKPEVKKKRQSNAEYCKVYREKFKHDESYQEKNKDKCKAYRNCTLTAEDLETKREANRIRNKKYRDSKNQKAHQEQETVSPLMTSMSKPKPELRKAISTQREVRRKQERTEGIFVITKIEEPPGKMHKIT